jgi:hypothetical protein
MIIVPIGIDCGVAEVLKKYELRKFALPFDWVVTYRGIKHILENDFEEYIPNKVVYEENKNITIFNKYDVKFIHDKLNKDDIDKYKRRIERLKNILNNDTEEVVFIKKGHTYHHHGEYNFIDDVQDVIELNNYLKNKYKTLKYKIIIVLLCNQCYKGFNDILDERIKIIKRPIVNIMDNLLHNKIMSGKYFEQAFIEEIKGCYILST